MRQKKQAANADFVTPARGKSRIAVVSDTHAGTAYAGISSPAYWLQEALANEREIVPAQKWPPAATLGFVLLTCGGFWTGIGMVVTRLF